MIRRTDGARLGRREFLRLGGIAGGLAFLPGAAWPSAEPGIRSWELVAQPAEGVNRAGILTYNGTSPGPELRMRAGETIRLRLVNRLSEPTNLHFHGLHIPPDGNADNVRIALPPGERFDYQFTVAAGDAGLHWYHPHVHGATARQMFGGLAGPIVIEGDVDRLPEIARAEERVIVLKDWTPHSEGPTAHTGFDWIHGKEGGQVLVNGSVRPRLRVVRPLVRLRLVNACNARYFLLRLDRLPLHVIALDGRFLEKPVAFDEILLVPGGRVEALVPFERPGLFDLVNLPYDRVGRTGHPPQPILTVEATTAEPAPRLPQALSSVEDLSGRKPAAERRIEMSLFYLNGRPFDHHRIDIAARLGDIEHWEIANIDSMDHPFHLHTWPFQILERNGRPEPFRAWRDTINLRPGDVARLAVPLRNHAGRSVYHCHIVEHGDRSMMGQIEVSPG